jgi:Protein of unknown function (DUF1501)
MLNRRGFLNICSGAGLGFAASVSLTRDARGLGLEQPPYEGPYYVVLNAAGGWDTTYLMDPKGVEGINRLYQQADILTAGAHQFAPTAKRITAGLSTEKFYEKYAAELLTINGIDFSVNNHTPCARYMATGKLDSLAYPTFPALVAACFGKDLPIAFLTFGNYSATGNLVPMSRIPYLHPLGMLAKADFVEASTHSYHEAFVTEKITRALESQFQARVSKTALPRVERSQSMLYSAQTNSKMLERIVPFIPKEPSRDRLGQQVDISLAAFKAGVCVSANLSIGQFDSHNNNDQDQMKLIPEFLAGADYLMHKAEELQIRDKLVVIMQSEMARTPNYNTGHGKDHWSIGSLFCMGAGITGNRVIGATDAGQMLIPINPLTLTIDQEHGIRMRPEHFHQALRELSTIDDHPLSQQFPLQVPHSEQLAGLWH